MLHIDPVSLKPRFLIESGYYIVPSDPSIALVFSNKHLVLTHLTHLYFLLLISRMNSSFFLIYIEALALFALFA